MVLVSNHNDRHMLHPVRSSSTPWKVDERAHDLMLKWSSQGGCMSRFDGDMPSAFMRGVVL
jgi:hypothetical protein